MEANVNEVTNQFVLFKLGKEEYGIDTLKVTSIVEMMTITRVPQTPEFIKGVINLRGDIIPIMDLRTRFNLPTVAATEDTRIMIIKIQDASIGIIVDSVNEVVQLNDDSIESISSFSSSFSIDYILGVGKIGERIVTLLNLENLMDYIEKE